MTHAEAGYRIRPAAVADLRALPAIERAAGKLFESAEISSALDQDETTLEELCDMLEEGLVLVAVDGEDRPVGFACVEPVDGNAHLDELDVHPEHGRRGLGRRLVRAVCDWARERGYPAVTLTTFRRVPWNQPFYEALGFRALPRDEHSPTLAALMRSEETERGLLAKERVVMRFETSP